MKKKLYVLLATLVLFFSTIGGFNIAAKISVKITDPQNKLTTVTGTLSQLAYYPVSHDFGDKHEGEIDSSTFEIWNSGCCTLTYSLSENCGWVGVNPTDGYSYGEHDTITVSIDTSGLSVGFYQCDILINSNGGSGVFTVYVNIIMVDLPVLYYYPFSYDFGDIVVDITDSMTFEIWNSGCCTLTYSLSENCGWVGVNPIEGYSNGEHDTITVSIDTSGLSVGFYQCDILINSNAGNAIFPVSVNIVLAPLLNYYPLSYDFGNMVEGMADFTTFEIWNSGCCVLTFSLNEDRIWVDVFPRNGSSVDEDDTCIINISIDTNGLPEGPHGCNILILSNGGIKEFPVSVNILKTSNSPPIQPIMNGPTSGVKGEEYYYLSSATDPNGDQVYYWFDWGDGSNSGWLGPYYSGETAIASHSWSKNGFYDMKVKARDEYNEESEWSPIYTMVITTPPNKPNQPSGPVRGRVDKKCTYSSSTIDPDGDNVYYWFDWGDGNNSGWIGSFTSGEIGIASHSWSNMGDYSIKVKAKDEHGIESDWSDLLLVTMPKIIIDSMLLLLLINQNNDKKQPILIYKELYLSWWIEDHLFIFL